MHVAIAGSTGVLGSHLIRRVTCAGHIVTPIARYHGVDLVTGRGLDAALDGVDVVIDASDPRPRGLADGEELRSEVREAAERLLEAAYVMGAYRLISVSVLGVEHAAFDAFAPYLAKREKEAIAHAHDLPTTVVKASHFHEFALNPAGVHAFADQVLVQDMLLQPVAAGAVAAAITEMLEADMMTEVIELAGPEEIRLPELTRRVLDVHRDRRAVMPIAPLVRQMGTGVLLAPDTALMVGPTVTEWLDIYARDNAVCTPY
ncbi:SDR family oxidoreductase [Streptomyces alanosinicus]|uniref:NAD-dependent epimerase/dehydratase domain-containing protein n=1 Tax=Streptomyces alanosinicus TaxID=68171 RepID=A0A918YNV0_9ACTN|nr:NAD-dependent epimerase/dehydratase family protein [Streptomyces alanosinicus]GHE10288.1 hypothetical protein GCM10010339_65870 [Streptomyces alanosinicus]